MICLSYIFSFKFVKRIVKLYPFFILLLFSNKLFSQSNVVTSGGDIDNKSGSISYTVGQINYNCFTNSRGFSVTEGVQQAFNLIVETDVDTKLTNTLSCSVFPNPTSRILNIKVDMIQYQSASYQLFDINGKLLMAGEIKQSELNLSMDKFDPAIYFLNVFAYKSTNAQCKVEERKTFKIIKQSTN